MAHHHHHHHHHHHRKPRSQTLPSSPTHSSSSSDFEFTISPRKSSATNLCPADDLFYKGQLLPLHLSPRISMVRTLLLSSSSTSSSATTARHSSDSHSSFSTDGCDSSRPSSVADDDLHLQTKLFPSASASASTLQTLPFITNNNNQKKPNKYFSLSRFSSVFRKETKSPATATTTATAATSVTTRIDEDALTGSSVKRMSVTAKEMIRKYLKKAKPLYEKLSQSRQGQHAFHVKKTVTTTPPIKADKENDVVSHSFSGNLRYPRRRSCVSSCPSSMRSSPSHSGVLSRGGVMRGSGSGSGAGGIYSSNSSSMEELQSAIQGAIAHCKNSMTQNN